jgi:DNA-binding GntR family transcriptional regulator
VDPDELHSEQGPDRQVTQELTIGNLGTSDLDWSVFENFDSVRLPSGGSPVATEAGTPSGEASLSTSRSLLGGVFGAPMARAPSGDAGCDASHTRGLLNDPAIGVFNFPRIVWSAGGVRVAVRSAEPAALAELAGDRSLLGRSSTVERVAGVLRERIIEGLLVPGSRLSEDAIGAALGVSRNTLREAFRVLAHERLVVHELNRGVFVRTLAADDVVDVFRARRLIECAAVRAVQADALRLGALRAAVDDGERAAADGRGSDVGTANMRFHQGIAALAGSPRVDDQMRQLLAELRLVFHVMDSANEFHMPYVQRNREILTLLEAGDLEGAHSALKAYLDDAERQLLAAFASAKA